MPIALQGAFPFGQAREPRRALTILVRAITVRIVRVIRIVTIIVILAGTKVLVKLIIKVIRRILLGMITSICVMQPV